MTVLAFARLRELLGDGELALELPPGARVRDAWDALAGRVPALRELAASTRAAIGDRVVGFDEALHDGAGLAFLPPVGGG